MENSGENLRLNRIKVLIAKLGIDTHWRGAITVAYLLKNAGMDVIYLGNSMPEDIIEAVIDEDPQVVGVSSLGGAHLSLGRMVIELAKKNNVFDRVYVIGGVIPPADVEILLKNGYDLVFGPGATEREIIDGIVGKLLEKGLLS